jgi:hypothetical protein
MARMHVHETTLADLVRLRPEGVARSFAHSEDLVALVYKFPASELCNVVIVPPKRLRFTCSAYLGQSHIDWLASTSKDRKLKSALKKGLGQEALDLAEIPWCFSTSALDELAERTPKVSAKAGTFEVISIPVQLLDSALTVAQANCSLLLDWCVPDVVTLPSEVEGRHQAIRRAMWKPNSVPDEEGELDLSLSTAADDEALESACYWLAQVEDRRLEPADLGRIFYGKEFYRTYVPSEVKLVRRHPELRSRLLPAVKLNGLRASFLRSLEAPHFMNFFLERIPGIGSSEIDYDLNAFDIFVHFLGRYPESFDASGLEGRSVQAYVSNMCARYPVLRRDPFGGTLDLPQRRVMRSALFNPLLNVDPISWSPG